MVTEIIRYKVAKEKSEDFIKAYGAASKYLDSSEHCLAYNVIQGIEEPENFIVQIIWDSVTGHEQGFRKEPGFMEFFKEVKPFFDDIQEMKHYKEHLKSA